MKQYEESLWRTEAERLLKAAQGCSDPNLRDQLISMANEYLALLGRRSEDNAGVPDGTLLN
jgi:hypothetical protein